MSNNMYVCDSNEFETFQWERKEQKHKTNSENTNINFHSKSFSNNPIVSRLHVYNRIDFMPST